MIFTRLSMTDFGLFRGSHVISLAPKPGRPVILFGGKNGAGKSTLFEAVRLCLYGQKAFGGSLSKDAYLSYLSSRMHSNPTLLVQPNSSSIALDFNYADAGQVHAYRVTRSWERRGTQKVQEQVEVTRDGKALEEVSDEYWQDFVRDMVPPGISQLFFFDGEKIQHLAEDASDQASLADSIKSLLGLDLIDRLQSDLGYFIARQIAPSLDQKSSGEMQTLECEQKILRTQIDQLRAKRTDLESKLAEERLAIQRVEAKLTSSGGTFSRSRESLIQKKATIKAGITQHEAALRQLCSGMLPFALVPNLCQQVADQLSKEESAAQAEAGIKLLQEAKKELAQRISNAPLWSSVSPAVKSKLCQQLAEVITHPLKMETAVHDEPIHAVSPTERRQIISWIQQAKTEVPIFLHAMGTELESFYRDFTKVEVSLKKIPADEVIKPLVEELNQLHQQFAEIDREAKELEQEFNVAEARHAEVSRLYQKQLATFADRD